MRSIKSCVLVFLSIFALVACTDAGAPPPPSEPPVERAGDNDQFTTITSASLRAMAEGERLTVDLRPDGAAFAVKFESPDDLARVWVIDYREDTGEADEYVLADRAPLTDGQVAGTVVFGHGDMGVLQAGDRGCVCIEVCCWRWRCYCDQQEEQEEE